MGEKTITEYRGIRDLVAAELLTDTSEGLTYGEVFPIAGIAELSKTTANSSESHYYDNVAAIVIDSVGADEVTCTCSAIPLDVLAKLTGQYYDSATNTFVEGEATRPYFAVGYITEDTDGHEIFVWRHKVKCSIPDSTHSTKNDGTDANGQEIKFTGINTLHKFTKTGKTAKAINHKAGDLIDEATFFSEVYDIDKLNTIAPSSVANVTFNPNSTTFADSQIVTLSCSTQGSTIKYQVGGSSAPGGTWSTYSEPLTISETTTIWARAELNGNTSTITSATYTKSE